MSIRWKYLKPYDCVQTIIIIIKYKYYLSEFLRWSLMILIIKGFRTIVFIFIVISTTFQPICQPGTSVKYSCIVIHL